MRVLSYTTESLRKNASELREKFGISVSHVTVGEVLDSMHYSKQVNQKMLQKGEPYPNRNAQFEYINAVAADCLAKGEPVVSVDTKMKDSTRAGALNI